MHRSLLRGWPAAAATLALAPFLAGCSGSDALSAERVSEPLAARLADAGLLADPDSLSCDGDAVVGKSLECTFTANGQPVALTAKVGAVDGDKVEFDLTATAQPVAADVLADNVKTAVGQQVGAVLDDAACEAELAAEVEATTTCTVTAGEQTRDFLVTVTTIDGGRVDYRLDPK